VAMGHEVVVFEASETLGGVWAVSGSARRARTETLSTSSVENTVFLDFDFDFNSDF